MLKTADAGRIANLNGLTKAIRACFQRLKAFGEALHEDLGLTVAMRAVLEAIVEDGPQTVPQIARVKCVTRQHIQAIVDSLVRASLVRLEDNPAHLRSPLVSTTDKGRTLFAEMRKRERRALAQIARALPDADVAAARRTLGLLAGLLETQLETQNE